MILEEGVLERARNGLTFERFMQQWRDKNALSMKGLDKVQRRTRFYSKYNLERQERVQSEWQMSPSFEKAVREFEGPLCWLFITDDWCIDSAYSLPLLLEAAEMRDDVTLSILMKDDNLDILDLFLTNGARSIPKLIAIEEDGSVRYAWGPQPEKIRLIRKDLIESGAEGRIVSGTTIDWYADKGWLEVEKELTELFS